MRFSARLPRGALNASAERCIVEADSGLSVQDASTETLTLWPDGSVDWIAIELGVSIAAYAEKQFELIFIENPELSQPHGASDRVSDKNATILATPVLSNGQLRIGLGTVEKQSDATLSFYCVDQSGTRHVYSLESMLKIDNHGKANNHRSAFRVQLNTSNGIYPMLPNMTVQIDIYPAVGLVELEMCVHNPAAAEHAKGLWDLGDPASCLFQELGFSIDHPGGGGLHLLLDGGPDRSHFEASNSLEIEQLSSGGINKNSSVHVDREGICPRSSSGFEACCDGIIVATGSRVSPSVAVALTTGTLTTHLSRFWQEFPSALRLTPENTTVALFTNTERMHELQPGERKRRSVSLHFNKENLPTKWLSCRLGPPEIAECGVIALEYFQLARVIKSEMERELYSLIASPDEFFNKREIIDEYGWRHFGEVFADHETLYQNPSDAPIISHYNNQYDQVLGFGLQFLRTRDARWFDLMNDLARHVTDIDMYRTTEDRVEYNNGLFWHTNHYENAATATHRTFSISNYDPASPFGQSGGPGPEHCYTSGLALHYFLTGDNASKEAVIELAYWIKQHFHGDESLLGRLHSIAKHELPSLKKLLIGGSATPYRYPLTRGTGNLLVALLDAYVVTGNHCWIDQAESVIFFTFHPADDPAERDLENIERTWSHTIFLQAVLRFIAIKDSLDEFDAAREYAKRGFLTYARYTLENGRPYLENPERLEFVNETWAAQDIRRYNIMCAASFYAPSLAGAYTDKAIHFGSHILERLKNSEELRFSRIQAIIMQNVGSATWFELQAKRTHQSVVVSALDLSSAPKTSIVSELHSAASKLAVGIKRFDANQELRWFRLRR